jgi:MFS transporter, DHA1 family, multidrug resistance protein
MSQLLKNKQILALFISSFAVLFTGMGLLPILPLFAATFGANNSTTGFYMAIVYAVHSLGPVAAAWLIVRFSSKMVFVGGALVGLPALIGLALAQTFTQVIVFTALLWFSGGVVMALVSILTGQHADAGSQGKAFSLMAVVGPLGALAGGAVVGQMVAWQGYALMFAVLALVWSAVPLIGWLALEVPPSAYLRSAGMRSAAVRPASQPRRAARLGPVFARTMAVSFLGTVAVNVSRFGNSLSMQSHQFSPEVVSYVAMLSGLVAIPVTMATGAFSDRLGRKHFLFVSYLFAMSGSLILIGAAEFWQFSLASVLLMVAFSTSGAMAQAITSEVVPAESVSQGLSWLNTLGAAANILCFAAGGLLYDLLGMPVVFLISALAALAAGAGIEVLVHTRRAVPALEECTEA